LDKRDNNKHLRDPTSIQRSLVTDVEENIPVSQTGYSTRKLTSNHEELTSLSTTQTSEPERIHPFCPEDA